MSGRTLRRMAWPLEPGAAPKINELVAGLIEEIDGVQPDGGGQIILVEMSGDDAFEFLRLAERLTAAWEARGYDSLVVDAHPSEPFTADCFEGNPEGLTEIFHYGLSPEAAVRHRDGCSGLWIPAGGKWNLPLESPDEPQLTLFRMAGLADKVLLLADRANDEGFLDAFRDHAHYRLILVSGEEAVDLPDLPTAEPIVALPVDDVEAAEAEPSPTADSETTKTPVPVVGDNAKGVRKRRLLPLLLPIIIVAWYFSLGPGRSQRNDESVDGFAAGDSGFSHLPAPVELPYSRGVRDEAPRTEESSDATLPAADGDPRLGEGSYLPIEPAVEEPTPVKVVSEAPPKNDVVEPGSDTTARPPRRRFESRDLWQRAKLHSGVFQVHVESYQDSVLGARSARERGFDAVGFSLRPHPVRDKIYYRLLVGTFTSLPAATAYRDSLLDHTDENYCTIAIEASE